VGVRPSSRSRATAPDAGTADPAPIGEARSGLEAVESAIRTYLEAHARQPRGAAHPLPADRNLWRDVDSLTMLQLVAFVEHKFSIKVRPIDFAPQNFSTISAIARLVVARRGRTTDS
jgi:acyl carrier protein